MWWVEPAIVYLRHYKKPLLIAASVAAIAGAGYFGGVIQTKAKYDAADLRKSEKVIEKVVTEYVERDAEERVVYIRDLEATRRLEAERDRLRTLNNELQEQVSLYVPQDATGGYGTYIPVGAVRLLDRAADPDGAAAAELSAAAPAETDFSASDINWRDLASYTVRVAGQYNDVRAQCNALIEWTEQNVVRSTPQ